MGSLAFHIPPIHPGHRGADPERAALTLRASFWRTGWGARTVNVRQRRLASNSSQGPRLLLERNSEMRFMHSDDRAYSWHKPNQ